jgi:valyl-tRNA synthetase
MIMAGFEYMEEKPFREVYFTGIVRDKQGRKMSKSLGNSPDLLGLIDQYGADAVRFGILISSPAGNDLLFDESALEQGRNFNNKIWNALKLIKMWEARVSSDAVSADNSFALNWFENKLNQVVEEVEVLMQQFRLSEALKTIYSLIWDDFCSWYLEWVKPGFEQPVDATMYNKTIEFFEALLKLAHPFMPFITEEIFHLLRVQEQDLVVSQLPPANKVDNVVLKQGELLKQVITNLRDGRNKNQLKPQDSVKLYVETGNTGGYNAISEILSKQINATEVVFTAAAVANTIVIAVEQDKFYLETTKELDKDALKADLLKDLAHQQQFLVSVNKKLSNEKFVQNAKPEVLSLEQKKQADAIARIKTIEESLVGLQ